MNNKLKQELFKLGVRQAQACLPLVFIQNQSVKTLKTEQRLQAQEMAKPLLEQANLLLDKNAIVRTDRNLAYMFLLNSLCIGTISDTTMNVDKVAEDNAKLQHSDAKISEKDANYLNFLSKISVSTHFMTLSPAVLDEYYLNADGEQGIPKRIKNFLRREMTGYITDARDKTLVGSDIRAIKYDLQKQKLTTMQTCREFLTVVPFEQYVGYVVQFQRMVDKGLYEVIYFRKDYKSRKQYVSRNRAVLTNIYPNLKRSIDIMVNYQSENASKPFNKFTTELIQGYLHMADVGMCVTDSQEYVSSILRRVTPTNILSLRHITDMNSDEVRNIKRFVDYDLNKVEEIFNQNLGKLSLVQISKLYSLMIANKNLIVASDSNMKQLDLQNSIMLTTEIYTTTGRRRLLGFMLDHPEFFNVPTYNEMRTDTQLKTQVYQGDDILGILNFGK